MTTTSWGSTARAWLTAWTDPDHERRSAAVDKVLSETNEWTEEAVAFAINHTCTVLAKALAAGRLRGEAQPADGRLALLVGDAEPFAGVAEAVVARSFGREVDVFAAPLNATLINALLESWPDGDVRGGIERRPLEAAPALALAVGWGRDGVEPEPPGRAQTRLRGGVAVLDGSETEDDLELLAQDMLLYDGRSERSVAIVWAPEAEAPDALLDALATFRGVFPASAATPKRLKMPRAFLDAAGTPHAFGEGLVFLLSKGDPEPQQSGHIRWAPYGALAEVEEWLSAEEEGYALLVAATTRTKGLRTALPKRDPGAAHELDLEAVVDRIRVFGTARV